MENLEQKKEIMRNRKEWKKEDIRIEDDLTWRQRKMRWRLEEIATEERKKEKKVWVKYGKIQIAGKWWKCDKEKESLVDGEERKWLNQGKRGEGRREKENREEGRERGGMENGVLECSGNTK